MKNKTIGSIASFILSTVFLVGASSAEDISARGLLTQKMPPDILLNADAEYHHLARAHVMGDRRMIESGKDYSSTTSSIAPTLSINPNFEGPASSESFICAAIAVPPAVLETQSKYRSDDATKSTLDEEAAGERDRAVRPIRRAIRALTTLAHDQGGGLAMREARADCVLGNLDNWAASMSLSKMRSTDAYLSRDRWIAEIVLALRAASRVRPVSPEREAAYRTWLSAIARDTIEAYTLRLGAKSRANNHRYWAGLSVAATGFYLKDSTFKDWGKRSFEIGACQVDERGFLPAELSRGKKALEYHVYALRPLAAIARLAAEENEPIESRCLNGFKRLALQTASSLADSSAFESIVGQSQSFAVRETSYSPALRLATLEIGSL